ncbi:hypothetical protein [uncultured Mediterranean phage uvMED]|nr:hypothetical protein [uncultured Mediterranean phage uvMED]
MIASAVFQAYGAIQAGKARKAEARMQRMQIEEQKKDAELIALQQGNARRRNLQDFLALNESITGVSGRDLSDRSLRALQERAVKESDETEDRARLQFLSEQRQRDLGIAVANMRGRNAMNSALISATSSLLTAGYKYQQVAPKGGATFKPLNVSSPSSVDFRGSR